MQWSLEVLNLINCTFLSENVWRTLQVDVGAGVGGA